MDEDSFQESFKAAAGAVILACNDEIPGEDQALGEPGVVMRNGLTVHFEGDSSDSRGEMEVVLTGCRRGVEYVTYVHARSLRMVNDDGDIELNGSQAQRKAGGIDGFLVAGQLSED
jgi:hypothetical protein